MELGLRFRSEFKLKAILKIQLETNKKSMKNLQKEAINTLHNQFKRYGMNAKEWMRKCILLLPEIERHNVWRKKGFGSIYEYAAKLAGMSRGTVDDALWILRKVEDKPKLRQVIEKQGINKIRPIVTIVTKETEDFWAGKAKVMSRVALQTYAHEFRRRAGRGGNEGGCGSDGLEFRTSPKIEPEKVPILMELSKEVVEKLEKLKGKGDWNELMNQLLELREKQLENNKPQEVATSSRHIPNEIKQYVTTKTNNQCAFPGCSKPCKILHHADRFALQKVHNPDRIIPLCEGHERLVHLGLIGDEEKPVANWRIREEANKEDARYLIDRKVGEYRMTGFRADGLREVV